MIKAWAFLDRQNSIRLIKKTNCKVQKELLYQWNEETPLSPEEWELSYEIYGIWDGFDVMVEEILAQSDTKLYLPEKLAAIVATNLRRKIITYSDEDDEKMQKEALKIYTKLVQNMEDVELNTAITFMKELFSSMATSNELFKTDFMKGFTLLGSIITMWSNMKDNHKEAEQYIAEQTPIFLKDFALAQWYASVPDTSEEAHLAYKEMLQKVKSDQHAEAWFFILLVERGLPEIAIQLVKESKNEEELLPNIQRALICRYPETARKILDVPDAKADIIGYFITLPSVEDRMNFLRDSTNKGSTSLSAAFWSKPDITDALENKKHDSLYNYYIKSAKKDEQFEVFLRAHGFQFYSHENIDPYLLAALVNWDDKYPEEVSAALYHMWNVMNPSDYDFMERIYMNYTNQIKGSEKI